MTELSLNTQSWRFKRLPEALEASLTLDLSPAGEAERRQLYHDYVGAIRTLRYLAQKALKGSAEEEAKQEALTRHLQNLETIQSLLIDPLLRPDLSHES